MAPTGVVWLRHHVSFADMGLRRNTKNVLWLRHNISLARNVSLRRNKPADASVLSTEFLIAPGEMFYGGIKRYKNKICEVAVFGIRKLQIYGSTKKGDADV